ncbi:hypothetical protein DL769_010319 [Monosporascus sp. CRB-8-3]|nr:hypothetical protein DL769_010319 [Monosporascus sp. CRB-8-3]
MPTAANPPPFMSSSSSGPPPAAWDRSQAARDASNLHPVFFTGRWRRAPFAPAAAARTSPVAHGYVYQAAPRRGADGAAVARL